MPTRKAYKFSIYPNPEQEELFRRTIGCCRLVYNNLFSGFVNARGFKVEFITPNRGAEMER